MANILECRGLVKKYGSFIALNGLNFAVPEGRIVGLLGTNGSGKTTLIKLAAGLLRKDGGEILIGGNPPSETRRQKKQKWISPICRKGPICIPG